MKPPFLWSIDGLEENVAKFYKEKEGKFVLDVDGHEKNEDTGKIPLSRLNANLMSFLDSESN